MLAKPEYFSPPDEVCCWLGRRSGAFADRGASAEFVVDRGAAAEHHREDIAGMGRCSRLAGSNVEEMLMAGPPWQSLIGKNLLLARNRSR